MLLEIQLRVLFNQPSKQHRQTPAGRKGGVTYLIENGLQVIVPHSAQQGSGLGWGCLAASPLAEGPAAAVLGGGTCSSRRSPSWFKHAKLPPDFHQFQGSHGLPRSFLPTRSRGRTPGLAGRPDCLLLTQGPSLRRSKEREVRACCPRGETMRLGFGQQPQGSRGLQTAGSCAQGSGRWTRPRGGRVTPEDQLGPPADLRGAPRCPPA